MILAHGRGGTATGILALAMAVDRPDVAWLAPQAANHAWYPHSFLAPLEENEPELTSALSVLEELLERLTEAGVPPERTIVGGFSQGACLALEFVARHPGRYGGVAGLAGGLIGPPGTERSYPGSLDGVPAFLGCGDRDPHIPVERITETATVLERMGALVSRRIYPGMGHVINDDEVAEVCRLIDGAGGGEAR